jgi:formamidopyrimidine-DNA glycosylase
VATAYPEAVCIQQQLVRALSHDERGAYVTRWYGRAVEPHSEQYTWQGFHDAVSRTEDTRLSAKKFLHAFEPGYYVSGLDSGYAVEILHRAKIHPRRRLLSLSLDEQRACYDSVNTVTAEAIGKGGRRSEVDLYGRPGGFLPHVCRARLGHPCLACGTPIEKLRFEGGACYLCPNCQPLQAGRRAGQAPRKS